MTHMKSTRRESGLKKPPPFLRHTTLVSLKIRGIMDGENDPGGPNHARTYQSTAANCRLR